MTDSREFVRNILVDLVRRTPSIGSRLVREQSLFSQRKGDESLNTFVAKLSDPDREVLALMLQNERTAALFDALVWLHESCALHGIRLRSHETYLNLEPDGYTMFEEYLALLSEARPHGDTP